MPVARATVAKPALGSIVLPPIERRRIVLRITGESPLVTHKFSEKAKKMMLDKMMGKASSRTKKEPKDPEAEYEASKYLDDEGRCCVRAVSLKKAAIDAASQLDGFTKVFLKGLFHVRGELLPIIGEAKMREDMVRLATGVADLRYRAEFYPWAIDVPIVYNQRNIQLESLLNLFAHAGFSSGIGEYRPQRNGNWGMFLVTAVEDHGLQEVQTTLGVYSMQNQLVAAATVVD